MSVERWCERCECWSSGAVLLLPDGRCAVHLVPTETDEQIRRDRDALRADLARISAELGLPPRIGPAPGELARLLRELRALCRQAAERIDADALLIAELLDDQEAPDDGRELTDRLLRAAAAGAR